MPGHYPSIDLKLKSLHAFQPTAWARLKSKWKMYALSKPVINVIRKMFKDAHMIESKFTTSLKVAQGKMNQRPLVAISDDLEDQKLLTLTPAHLKLGKALVSLPSDFDELDDVANLSLKSRWEQRKRLQCKFFLRFKDEYLLNLSKLQLKQTKNVVIKQGDVVLLLDEKGSRDTFPIARVAKIFKGPDGVVRIVELRLHINSKPQTEQNNLTQEIMLINSFIIHVKQRNPLIRRCKIIWK